MSSAVKFAAVCGVLAVLIHSVAGLLVGGGHVDSRAQWLAWSPAERDAYVQGFIEGYGQGGGAACKLADELFEVDRPHRLGQTPGTRCENGSENYSKFKVSGADVDFSAYTTVLTEFFTKHPEYPDISESYLMTFLTDRNYKTAGQLYELALKHGLNTHL